MLVAILCLRVQKGEINPSKHVALFVQHALPQVDRVRIEPDWLRQELSVLHDWEDGLREESGGRRNPGPSLFC